MADGGANISRGLGRGAAQVYDTSSPVNMYAKLMQQQQLKRAAETKALTDELGKITPEGIRQKDVPGFLNQFDKWRSAAIEATNEKDPIKRATKNQIAEREKLATFMYKDDSKNVSKTEDEIQKMLLNPEVRDRYDDKDLQRIINSKNLSKDDPNFIRDYNAIQIKPDLSKIMNDLDKIDKTVLSESKWLTPMYEPATRGNVKGVFESSRRVIDPKKQAVAYGSLFDLDKKFRVALQDMFPDVPANQLKEKAIPLLVQQRVKEESTKSEFRPNKDLTMQNLAIRRENRLAAGEGGASPQDYAVEKIQLTTEPQFDKNEEPIAGTEKPSITLEKTVKTRSVAFPSTQMKAFDVANNKRIVLPARQDLKLARLAYVPTIGKDRRYELNAVVIDSDNKQYVIQETEIPIDIRRNKHYIAAKEALGSPPPPKGAKVENQPSSTISEQDKAALDWLKSNPNAPQAKAIRENLKAKGLIK